jgi:hypothetical protein
MTLALLSFGLTAGLFAQTTLGLNSPEELPSYLESIPMGGGANFRADHATVAISDGDHIFVAWHSQIDDSPDRFQVEGMLIPKTGSDQWTIPDLADTDFHRVLGDPALNIHGTDSDSCNRPDVVAVGENFIVTWVRIDVGNDSNDEHLEAVLIEVDIGSPVEIAMVVGTQAGEGKRVDEEVESGEVGVMPDLVALGTDRAGVIYVHEAGIGSSNQYRNHDIRFADLDCSGNSFHTEIQVLFEDQPLDHLSSGPMQGGNVSPDICADAEGNVVLAFLTFNAFGHNSNNDPQDSKIRLFRFSPNANASLWDWDQLDAQEFAHNGTSNEDPMRRPNLSGSELDFAATDNLLILTWTDTESNGSTPDMIRVVVIDYEPTTPTYTGYDHPTSDKDGHPIPLNLEGTANDAVLYDQDDSGVRTIRTRTVGGSSSSPLVGATSWRPALATSEYTGTNNDIMVLTWEGESGVSGVTEYRIFIGVTKK